MQIIKSIKSRYCKMYYNKCNIELSNTKPDDTDFSHFVLRDVEILFYDDSTIEVKGNRIIWDFSFDGEFLEDLSDTPATEYVKYGYKTIIDFFKRIKKPCVKAGWYKLRDTKPYRCISSHWNIVY